MDQDSVERIRSATFNLARRGYDRREVDTFLQQLADWLEGGGEEQAHSELVQRELERIGQRTAKVLTAAGEAAAALKADATDEAREALDDARIAANAARIEADRYAETTRASADEHSEAERGRADAYAQETRGSVDSYDEQTRTDADAYAGQTREEAEREADRILREGRKQRQSLETVIADLELRRDQLLDDLEQLAGSLVGTASKHRGADGSSDEATAALAKDSAENSA